MHLCILINEFLRVPVYQAPTTASDSQCYQTKLGSAHPLSVEPIYWHQDLVRESAGAEQRVRVANAQETQTAQWIPGKQLSIGKVKEQ